MNDVPIKKYMILSYQIKKKKNVIDHFEPKI